MMRTSPQSNAQRPAIRIDNVRTEDPGFLEHDLRALCVRLECGAGLVHVLVPRDTHPTTYGKRNPNYCGGRGFAVLLFESHVAAAAALNKLDGYAFEHSVLRAAWDNRRVAQTARCDDFVDFDKLKNAVPPPAPHDPVWFGCPGVADLAVDFPALPTAAPARAPVAIARPVPHVVQQAPPAPRPVAPPTAPGPRDIRCFYCLAEGHISKTCPVLAERECKACGLKGHTEKRCVFARILDECPEVPTTEIFEAY